jgi:hypothetical protein
LYFFGEFASLEYRSERERYWYLMDRDSCEDTIADLRGYTPSGSYSESVE